jgi:predicted anti-sigma-YlaC factor YlaD
VSAPPDEMSCKELVEVITDYLEETMAAEDRARFEAHLEECPYCREYVDQIRTLSGGLGPLREDTIAPETRDALLEAFRDWKRR